MRLSSFSLLSAALLLAGASASRSHGECPSCQAVDASILASTGTPVGKQFVQSNITTYISKPSKDNARAKSRSRAGVLYLTDVFGIALNENKLLADSFARAGYLTLAPDLFDGAPAPSDLNAPGFNATDFAAKHPPAVQDAIIAATVQYMHQTLGLDQIFATGYCWGGRYVFRFLAPSKGAESVDAGFAAHPSLLQTDEIKAIGGPVSVAAADHDELMPAATRLELEELLLGTGKPYQVTLYSGTQHGFGVRADMADRQQRFGKEGAFLQAVRWFDWFLEGGEDK